MKKAIKKIVLVLILVIIIVGMVWIAVNASKGKKELKTESNGQTTVEKVAQGDNKETLEENNTVIENTMAKEKIPATEKKLSDGIKYFITNRKEKKAEIVFKDNYYDTQISEINLNFSNYEGKVVEIEGLYFENGDYTFIGRYSTSNICPYCPTGYSYFEYQWEGDKKPELIDSESWIKVIGTLKKGNDGVEYYYIDADSIEVMNEKGQETVSN